MLAGCGVWEDGGAQIDGRGVPKRRLRRVARRNLLVLKVLWHRGRESPFGLPNLLETRA
jgi:hypothetical protein